MYTTKVYKAVGGDTLVVASGGKIIVQPGGEIEMSGEIVQSITFDEDYFTVSDGEVTIKAEVAALLTLVSGIPAADPEVAGQVWNDAGTLKVSEGA